MTQVTYSRLRRTCTIPQGLSGRDGGAALVSWSYDLLGEAERRLLDRLSALRGGFDLEVAERVAGGEPLAPQGVAGLLASLAGKSLVQIQAGR
jgi:predicted ATPase